MMRDYVGKPVDTPVLFVGDGGAGELFEAINKRTAEASKTIAMCGNCCVLAVIEVFANLRCGMRLVIEVGDEGGDGALKIDVVFP